jgi:chromosomal replication initiation ATPase DnaA
MVRTSRSELPRRRPEHDASAVIEDLSAHGLLDLVDQVCLLRGVTRLELCGSARTRSAATARHELWWRIRNHPERSYSYFEIARFFRRDHSTVVHGVVMHGRRYEPRP